MAIFDQHLLSLVLFTPLLGALVLLLVHARVPETTSAWSFLRYV